MLAPTELILFHQRQRDLIRAAHNARLATEVEARRARSYGKLWTRILSLFFVL